MNTCEIKHNSIIHNGETLFHSGEMPFADFAKRALKTLEIDYPKFFKMDSLSKLAFLLAEVLLSSLPEEVRQETALVFANKSASLDTDLKHQASIAQTEAYYPSPAVFVYTLPNICLGEISLRHHLHTESSFFIFENYQQASPFLHRYAQTLIAQGIAPRVFTAWVEILGEDYQAIGYLHS